MDDSRHAMRPVATPRPRGAPRLDAFSLKLDRRLTLFQRGAPELWLLIETDPAVQSFCERPGYVQLNGQRYLADFWIRYADREEVVILSDSLADVRLHAARPKYELDGVPVRSVTSTDLAAARAWIDNWRYLAICDENLPCTFRWRDRRCTSPCPDLEIADRASGSGEQWNREVS